MNRLNLLLILLFLISSCTHRLIPTWYDKDTDDSILAEITDQDVTIRVENLELKENQVIFDVEIINNADEHLCLNTSLFYHLTSQYEFKSLDTISADQFAYEYDSDWKKFNALSGAQVKKRIEDKIKYKEGANGFLVLLGAGLIIADGIQDIKDATDDDFSEADLERSIEREVAVASSLATIDQITYGNANKIMGLEEDLHYLNSEILEIDELAPKTSKRGKVYFSNVYVRKYSRLVLPIGETYFVFDFRKAKSAERQHLNR